MKYLFILLSSVLILTSCSKNEPVKKTNELLDMSNIEISKDGIQKLIDHSELNSNLRFNGTLLNVETISKKSLPNLTSNIDIDNVVLLEVMSNNGEIIKVYSAPSADNENEVIAFAEFENSVTNEIKFTFYKNSDGSTKFVVETLSNKKGWGGCMQDFLADPFIGTVTQVAGVAGGLGCVPCAGVAGFYTSMAALGCLAAI